MSLMMVNTSPEPHLDLNNRSGSGRAMKPENRSSRSSSGSSSGSLFFGGYNHSCTQEIVNLDLVQVHKKFKAPSIRKWISTAVKGRRKDKETPMTIQDEENRQYLEDEYVNQQICDVDFSTLVELPHGLDYNEWLATHTISFFEHISLMYDAVSDYCTTSGCSNMTGPSNSSYVWEDSRGKKCKCTAPQYVDYVMSHSQTNVRDEAVFPTKYGNVFPSSFESKVKKIHRLLFHVIAHIYHSHYKEILFFKLHPHLNTLFIHFMAFSRRFRLLEEHKDTDCMDELYSKLVCASVARRHPDKMSEANGNGEISPSASKDSVSPGSKSAAGSCSSLTAKEGLPPPPTAQELEENKENLIQDRSTSPTPPPPEAAASS